MILISIYLALEFDFFKEENRSMLVKYWNKKNVTKLLNNM